MTRPRAAVRDLLARAIATALAERDGLLDAPKEALARTRAEKEELELRVQAAGRTLRAQGEEIRLWNRPFEPDMSIHQAWLRHPAAREVFARYHLPACDQCAVRFDESVAEAASAYGLDAEALIRDLNGLLGSR